MILNTRMVVFLWSGQDVIITKDIEDLNRLQLSLDFPIPTKSAIIVEKLDIFKWIVLRKDPDLKDVILQEEENMIEEEIEITMEEEIIDMMIGIDIKIVDMMIETDIIEIEDMIGVQEVQ